MNFNKEAIKNAFYDMYCRNFWIVAHFLGALIGTKIGMKFLPDWITLTIVFILAVIWEILEFRFEITPTQKAGYDIVDWGLTPYKKFSKWMYDTIGDISIAAITALIVLYL